MQRLNRELFSPPSDGGHERLNGDTYVSGGATGSVPTQVTVDIETSRHRGRDSDRLVSCLMVTLDRFRQAQVAVECFLKQTFERRELVVLDGSDDPSLRSWLGELGDPRIRVTDVRRESRVLGLLRNMSVDIARGTHICQWDDDDLSHPMRIEAQMAVLEALGARASLLVREMIWFTAERRLGVTDRRPQENTLLCEKSAMPVYPPLERREDTPAVGKLIQSSTVAYLDQPELYLYLVHGDNTWDIQHMERMWHAATERFHGSPARRMLRLMSTSYPIDAALKAARI